MLSLNHLKTNLVSRLFTTTRSLTNLHKDTIKQQSKSVQNAIKAMEEIAKRDAFKGLVIDFTAWPIEKKIPSSRILNKTLNYIIQNEKENTHVFGLKVPSNNNTLISTAINHGFRFHNANPTSALLNLCLENHEIKQCTFPPFRTVSVGVTGVVFDRELKNVLVVMEKIGVIKKFKPPTGGVDYGEGRETPLDAVVRELEEEVNIKVERDEAVFVGTGWTNNYREYNPDISYIFAFVMKKKQELNLQHSEISNAKWISIEEFKEEPVEEKQKPWVLRQAVIHAFEAVQKRGLAWKPRTLYLSTGKPVEFFSAYNESRSALKE